MTASNGFMIDVTGANFDGLLEALGSNFPDTIASYVTGTGGVAATPEQFAELTGKTGVFRYDQTPELADFAAGLADAADVEAGAGTIEAAVKAVAEREARGWYSWVYLSADNLPAARAAVDAAKLTKIQFGVANWNLNQAEAKAFVAANADVAFVQWASPSSNPNTICPGTRKTLAQLGVDLNVTLPGWFTKQIPPPPPPPPVKGLVVKADFQTVPVVSKDNGKTWVA